MNYKSYFLTFGFVCLSPLQCLRAAFLSCVEEWVAESPWREERVPSLPWAHLAHNQFKSRLQNFSRILAVHPRVTAFLLRHQGRRAPPSEMVKSLCAPQPWQGALSALN